MYADFIEIVGAVTMLLAFAAAQAGRLRQRTVTYQLLNLIGSGVLATIAAIQLSWGFLLLEGSWAGHQPDRPADPEATATNRLELVARVRRRAARARRERGRDTGRDRARADRDGR